MNGLLTERQSVTAQMVPMIAFDPRLISDEEKWSRDSLACSAGSIKETFDETKILSLHFC